MPDIAPETTKLGRYDIVRVLGAGAMGVVYEAIDPNLKRRVAIKTVRVGNLSRADAAEYEARFRTEAHSAARLQHPNIVSVYDSDRYDNIAYLVMEYVQGQDLKHYLDSGHRYALHESVSIMCDLLAALEYAHEHKIIHRDIKPANLLIEPNGRVKLADFGVARIQDSGEATRTQGGVVGTLKYMAPEQIEGRAVDSRSDMFAAGIVLYQLLTDSRPFDGDSYFAIVNQITNLNPPPPSSINPELPVELDDVIAKALAKDKNQRYQTAHDFAFALRTAARQADPTITPSARSSNFNSNFGSSHSSNAPSSGSGPQSVPHSSAANNSFGTATSPVAQEQELVYWKDVKDSTEPSDLEGFLSRFPNGVYAELSKRQLKRLSDASIPPAVQAYVKRAHAGAQPPTAQQGAQGTQATQVLSRAVSDEPTRTSMFDIPVQEPAPPLTFAAFDAQGDQPPLTPTGRALVALQNKMREPMVIKTGMPHDESANKVKSSRTGWVIGGIVLALLLASLVGWFVLGSGDGADIIMFTDVIKVMPR
jgi:eukaryotic-like serine/threonine-protein kinase